MTRALLVFIFLLGLLGLGTALLVEKYSGERVLPRSLHGFSLTEVRRSWARAERAVKALWEDLTGKPNLEAVPRHRLPQSVHPGTGTEPSIIKWQDEQGVWHYEYASPGTSAAPTPPP